MSDPRQSNRNEGDPVRTIAAGRFVRLVERGGWEYVERVDATGIVAIVAVTNDEKLLLVEQYRAPQRTRVLELPAGLAGDHAEHSNEELVDAARRELLEETGFEASAWTRLTAGPPSAGLSTEVITLFLARGLMRVGPAAGDGTEEITLHEIALSDADDWLTRAVKQGRLIDPKVYAGLYFARR